MVCLFRNVYKSGAEPGQNPTNTLRDFSTGTALQVEERNLGALDGIEVLVLLAHRLILTGSEWPVLHLQVESALSYLCGVTVVPVRMVSGPPNQRIPSVENCSARYSRCEYVGLALGSDGAEP